MKLNRRTFLSSAACVPIVPWTRSWRPRRPTTIRDKLRLGVVGVAGRGGDNLRGVAGEEIVALCDIDARRLGGAAKRFPNAEKFVDARELIDTVELDAVVVSTPDHTHAPITARALKKGLHVYCEKPLTHTVHEARVIRQLARKHGRVTQMGIQIHSGDNYRRVVEAIQSGAVGRVKEAHVLCSKSWSRGRRPEATDAVPDWLSWENWLGPAASRGWKDKVYHPGNWRRFWEFGGGTLGDMACHWVDLVWWALELQAPKVVRAKGPEVHEEGTPKQLHVHYEHPERGDRRACDVHWYDGGMRPKIFDELGLQKWRDGVLFVGEDGRWLISSYGQHTLGPEGKFTDYAKPEPTIPKSIGQHREWIEACKNDGKTTCNFDYSGPMTEAVLLGNVAFRAGTELHWNSERLRVENSEAAQKLIRKDYARGWEL